MRIIVTGGAGFIGSRLVPLLLSKQHECLVIDDLSVGLPAPEPVPGLRFERMDICSRALVADAIADFHAGALVHLAAIHHIPTCENNAPRAFEVNVVGFENVLDACTKGKCNRVLLASSGAVYDWLDQPLVEEHTPVRARDVYSLCKATNEQQLHLWSAKGFGTPLIARIFNTIGKNDPNAHLIPDISLQLSAGRTHCVINLGNTHTRRDYIHVEDTAACLAEIITNSELNCSEIFNIGTGVEHDVRDVVDCIARLRGCSYEIVIDPQRVRRVDRPGQRADVTKVSQRLNWKPRHCFEEAVQLTVS